MRPCICEPTSFEGGYGPERLATVSEELVLICCSVWAMSKLPACNLYQKYDAVRPKRYPNFCAVLPLTLCVLQSCSLKAAWEVPNLAAAGDCSQSIEMTYKPPFLAIKNRYTNHMCDPHSGLNSANQKLQRSPTRTRRSFLCE